MGQSGASLIRILLILTLIITLRTIRCAPMEPRCCIRTLILTLILILVLVLILIHILISYSYSYAYSYAYSHS